MRKTQSPWGEYQTDLGNGRSGIMASVVFKPIAKDATETRSMQMEPALAKEKAELFAAEDWNDYGKGKNRPRKRREFPDA